MGKIVKFLFVGLVVLLIVFLVGKNVIVKVAVEQGVRVVTGLPLKMQSLDISLSKTYVRIQGLQLLNPAGFPEKMMVDLPEIYVDYDLPALFKKQIHLNEVRLNLQQFNVVQNQNKEVNLDALKSLQPAPQPGTPAEKPAPAKKEEPLNLQIDLLVLKVGKVMVMDYSKGAQPEVQTYQIGLDERIDNITDPNALVRMIVSRSLMKVPSVALKGLNINNLSSVLSGTVGMATDVTKEAVGTASDALKNATKGITDVIKLPFQKE